MGEGGKVHRYQCYSTKNLPVHLPYYLKKVSPLEDRLRGSLPGENMGPMQEEIRQ